jgi:hypothetical protein
MRPEGNPCGVLRIRKILEMTIQILSEENQFAITTKGLACQEELP